MKSPGTYDLGAVEETANDLLEVLEVGLGPVQPVLNELHCLGEFFHR